MTNPYQIVCEAIKHPIKVSGLISDQKIFDTLLSNQSHFSLMKKLIRDKVISKTSLAKYVDLYYINNELAGYLIWGKNFHIKDYDKILVIEFQKKYRGKGYAPKIIKDFIKEHKKVVLQARNKRLSKYYKRYGFETFKVIGNTPIMKKG